MSDNNLYVGDDWKTRPEFAVLRMECGAGVILFGAEWPDQGISADDIKNAVGSFVDMDKGCVLTFVATERTRLYVGTQVDRLREALEAAALDKSESTIQALRGKP